MSYEDWCREQSPVPRKDQGNPMAVAAFYQDAVDNLPRFSDEEGKFQRTRPRAVLATVRSKHVGPDTIKSLRQELRDLGASEQEVNFMDGACHTMAWAEVRMEMLPVIKKMKGEV